MFSMTDNLKTKKILFVTPKIPYPPVDGHKKSMFGVIKSLKEYGCDITLVCYSQGEIVSEDLKKYCRVFCLDVSTPNSIIGIIKNLFSFVPYNLWKYKSTELISFLQDHLKKENYDVIQVVNAHMGWVVDYLRDLTKASLILRQENLELSIMQKYYMNQKKVLYKLYSWIQYQKFLKYEPRLCEKFDLCIMISSVDEQKLLKLNPLVKTAVIPAGIDEELFEIMPESKIPFSLFHIGSLNWYPNLDGIIWFLKNVFTQIVKIEPRTTFYLYGGGFPADFILPEEIKKKVIVKGFVDDLWGEVIDKQIAIVPLRIGSGIRIKILELLAAKNLVISTSIGVEGIELSHKKNILIADTETEFIDNIISVFRAKFDVGNLTDSGRMFVNSNYKWNKIALQFINEYNKIENR